jgi:hypothetical protein
MKDIIKIIITNYSHTPKLLTAIGKKVRVSLQFSNIKCKVNTKLLQIQNAINRT